MEQTEYVRAWKALRLFQGNFVFAYGNEQTLHYFKKKKNQPGSRKRRGEKSKGLESVQVPARDRDVSGSWQPCPDEEPRWRHSKPGRAHGADGRERHSPPKTVTPGWSTLLPKPGSHSFSSPQRDFMRSTKAPVEQGGRGRHDPVPQTDPAPALTKSCDPVVFYHPNPPKSTHSKLKVAAQPKIMRKTE